jgi:pimeloyl-ACP methyl ester carboxylesterase
LDGIGIGATRLLGQHTGASVALEIAATRSDRVSKLILVGCPDYDPDVRAEKLAGSKSPFELDTDGRYLRYLWDVTASGPLWTGWAGAAQITQSVLNRLKAGPNQHFATLAVFEQDARERIPRIRCPVLLIHGDTDPFAARQPQILPLFTDARHAIMPDTAGVPMQQRPEDFAAHLLEFLRD